MGAARLHVDNRTKDADTIAEDAIRWLEQTLPPTVRRLMDTDDLDMPILQLPLAQLRLAQALYSNDPESASAGLAMGKLSDKLGVKQNALTQAADRLVNHKLAERISDPADRRVVRLRLTATGAEWVAERRKRRTVRLRQVFLALNGEKREEFLRAVHTLEDAVSRLETNGGDV